MTQTTLHASSASNVLTKESDGQMARASDMPLIPQIATLPWQSDSNCWQPDSSAQHPALRLLHTPVSRPKTKGAQMLMPFNEHL